MRGIASYAGPDDQWLASISVDGPIVAGLVSGRLALPDGLFAPVF